MSKDELSIVHVDKYGRRLTLNDGSKWEITPGDTSKRGLWYPTQRVIVRESKSGVYSHTLVNLDTAGPDEAEAHPPSSLGCFSARHFKSATKHLATAV